MELLRRIGWELPEAVTIPLAWLTSGSKSSYAALSGTAVLLAAVAGVIVHRRKLRNWEASTLATARYVSADPSSNASFRVVEADDGAEGVTVLSACSLCARARSPPLPRPLFPFLFCSSRDGVQH